MRSNSFKTPRRTRRGMALYLTVLSTAVIVSLLGISALTINRIERQRASVSSTRRAARFNSLSAVELALRVIANDPNWRTTYTSGVETTPQSLGANGQGTVSWILEDSDGSLTDADTNLRLKGVGRVGSTVQVSSIQMAVQTVAADYLRCPIHCTGRLTLTETCTAHGGPFSSNTDIFELSGGTFTGDAEAPAFVGDQGKLTGTFTTFGVKEMPPVNPFDTIYVPMATQIAWLDLPKQGSFRRLTGTLSATSNPFNENLNANGIYYIRIPALQQMKFKNFNLYGTLVVEVEDKGKIKCEEIDHMEPHSPNYPVMLLKALGTQLTCDLNGSNGATHSGLIHVIGAPDTQVTIGHYFNLTGTIVIDGMATIGTSNFSPILCHDPALETSPPLGYASEGEIATVPGTWNWDAAP